VSLHRIEDATTSCPKRIFGWMMFVIVYDSIQNPSARKSPIIWQDSPFFYMCLFTIRNSCLYVF
jgi:hypothetical protein